MIKFPETYELLKEEELSTMESKGYLLRHKKSGARVVYIQNEDDNKVFYIGFRTPVSDSTGVPHIIEHTVLCGSDKYPVKDPFVELVKGSLNTFLNAMTYPDKTVYPVASTNDKDFANLMDVYMDAVLHPNIYHHEEIFKQEGWHYEMQSPEDDLELNGVVYNEMKGAFSSAEDMLERQIFNSLFPDTTYHFESGGDPEVIPTLTYENFMDFHRRYYHPCNSYIYLYGDMDIEERLTYLDKEYLSDYEDIHLDSHIEMQPAFSEVNRVEKEYPITSDEDPANNTFLSYNLVTGSNLDPELYLAMDIVDQVILNSPGAPLRKALLEAEIAADIQGGFDTSVIQPMFTVELKGSEKKHLDQFLSIYRQVLSDQVKNGMDKKAILGAINILEFKIREADFGNFPKGLIYGLQIMDSWLYDDDAPFLLMHGVEILEQLKEKVNQGYFESLVQKYLLDNTHASIVILSPKQGLTGEREQALAKKLAEKKASLSQDEILKIVEETAHLKEYQATPSTQEELLTIPMLSREDLTRKVRPVHNDFYKVEDTQVVWHRIHTGGIHYLSYYFDITELDAKDYGKMALLSRVMGLMDTENYSYGDFATEIYLHTGGVASLVVTTAMADSDDIHIYFMLRGKFLHKKSKKAMELIEEMMLRTDYSDKQRLLELVKQEVSRVQMSLISGGHQTAASRVKSYFSEGAYIADSMSNIGYYKYLKDLQDHFEERADDLISDFRELVKKVFAKSRLEVSSTGMDAAKEAMEQNLPATLHHLYEGGSLGSGIRGTNESVKNEGFKTSSQVQFVARGGNFKKGGFEFTGAMKVLKTILGYDYFWMNVRVLGGAYGCMTAFDRNGNVAFASFRDPHLKETNDIFENTVKYLEDFDVSDRDMTKFVIGTVSSIDSPLTPSMEGDRSMRIYMTHISEEERQRVRSEVLDVTREDIRALAAPMKEVLSQQYICVIGGEDAVKENEGLFGRTESLQ